MKEEVMETECGHFICMNCASKGDKCKHCENMFPIITGASVVNVVREK